MWAGVVRFCLAVGLMVGLAGCRTGPKVGETAPDFVAKAATGETFRLSEHLSRGPMALYFHPDYEAPGCFTQDCSFRDRLRGLQEKHYNIVGIGYATLEREQTFPTKGSLQYTPIVDPDGAIARQYGVSVRSKPDGTGVYLLKRRTYLIGQDGRIESRMDVGPPCKCGPKLVQ